jgi:RNA polymerase sigma-70 factor (ECF subfamily)
MGTMVAWAEMAPHDAGLVGRCRRGETDAWPEFVRRFSPYVYAIAVRGFRLSEPDAEDVFQEVFIRAWQRLEDLRDDAAVRPWLGQLTRRVAVDRVRAGAREQARSEVEGELAVSAEDEMVRLEGAVAVRQAIARLPTLQRDVVERYFLRGESYAEIGVALDIAEGTVASRICRARARLRTQLTGFEASAATPMFSHGTGRNC